MSWRMAKHRYALVGTRCLECGEKHFPPRRVCPGCRSEKTERFSFAGGGVIESFTVIHTAPDGFDLYSPYIVGLVRLSEGPVISSHIVGTKERVKIGSSVRAVFRKIHEDGKSGVINYGFKFETI